MTEQEFQARYTYDRNRGKLGEGGFGTVFKAYDNYRDRWVALKIAEVDVKNESIRLRKEVEMVTKLPSHPNIAYYEECYTFMQAKGECDFGILQYYEEGNLGELLKNNTLTLEQKQSVLKQILEGIAFLHQNGIIHRDLKPQNILIAKRGSEYIPKITDFGISKQLDINKSSVFSNSIAGAGTLAYASPEQLSERTIRKNTDLWSFGVIAFQALTGQLPFNTGEHASTSEAGRLELFRQINSGKLPDKINTIKEPWQKLIRRCLVLDAAQRVQSEAELKDILMNLNKDTVIPEPDPTILEPDDPDIIDISDPNHGEEGHSKKYLLPIVIIAALLVVVVIFIFKSNKSSNVPIDSVSNMPVTISDSIHFTYSGRMVNGLPDGSGTAVYPNGDKYEGHFLNGLPDGYGTMIFANPRITYKGDYEKGKAEGYGFMKWPNGVTYDGYWHNNQIEGKGILKYADGQQDPTIWWLKGQKSDSLSVANAKKEEN